MILSALGQAFTVLFLGFTPKGPIPFQESMLYISTSPFLHPNDVERHNYPPFGTQQPCWRPSWACARSPYLELNLALIPYITACSKWYDIVCFGLSPHGFVLGFYPKRPHTIKREHGLYK